MCAILTKLPPPTHTHTLKLVSMPLSPCYVSSESQGKLYGNNKDYVTH